MMGLNRDRCVLCKREKDLIENLKTVDSGNSLQLIERCFEMHMKLIIIRFMRNFPDIHLNCMLCRQ